MRPHDATPPRPIVVNEERGTPLHLRATSSKRMLQKRCPQEEERRRASPLPDPIDPGLWFPPEQPGRGDEGCNNDALNKITTRGRRHRSLWPKSGLVFTDSHISPSGTKWRIMRSTELATNQSNTSDGAGGHHRHALDQYLRYRHATGISQVNPDWKRRWRECADHGPFESI
jgi:hypothetical protein